MRLKRLLGTGALASIPQVIDFATRFGRTIILAHMLSPVEFGISVAYMVLVAVAQLASDFGIEKFLVSRRAGEDAETLGAAHALLVIRSLIVTAAIFTSAPYIATLFGAPGHASGFRWVAAIMLMRDFEHLEMTQIRREFRYRPGAIVKLSSQILAFASVYPATLVFGDHRAMLVSIAVSAVVHVLASHLVAQRPYRLTLNRKILREAMSYGLPLTVSGIGIAANSQLDRALVSHWLGLGVLALYAVILNLATVPVALVLGILSSIGVPLLAQAGNGSGARKEAYRVTVWVHATIAAAYSLFVATTLGWLTPIVFGKNFIVSSSVQVLISLIVWVRLNRGAPNLLMLADGDTGRLMIANLISGIGLVLAILVLPFESELSTILLCTLVGEILSFVTLLRSVKRTMGSTVALGFDQLALSSITALAAVLSVSLVSPAPSWQWGGVLSIGFVAIATQGLFGIRRFLLRDDLLINLIGTTDHPPSDVE